MNNLREKNFKYVVIVFFLVIFYNCFSSEALAADRYWVGPAGGFTGFPTNWSSSSGGSGGATVPNIYDKAIFDGGVTNNATVNTNMAITDFLSTADYTGIVSIIDGVTLTVGYNGDLPSLVAVNKTGTQIATTTIPVTDQDLGGAFVLSASGNDVNIASIKLKQIGSLPADIIKDVQLSYEDSVGGQCPAVKSEGATSFGIPETLDENNTATFADTFVIKGNVPACLYVNYNLVGTYDVSDLGRTVDFEITNPSTDIIALNGSIEGSNPVNIPGQTVIVDPNSVSGSGDGGSATSTCSNAASSMLSLKMNDISKDPTVFYLQNCVIWKMEGGGAPIRLTNPNLKALSLNFINLTGANSGGTVKIEMTMSNVDATAGPSYINVTKTFSTTATVKAWGGGN